MNADPDFSSDAEVEALGRAVLTCTLPKASWTHRAHFAFALWVVTRRSDLDATRAVPEAIRRYNESTGVANTDTGGYHETITQASLRAARAFAHECGTPLYQTCNALMRSPLGTSDWLLAYWSRERLFSVEARRSWVDADRAPFPYAASPIIER